MDDLIDRQNAIDVLELLADKMSDEGKTVMAQAVAMLKDLQSAEPKRKKGKWVPHPEDREWDVCSVCGTGCKRREYEIPSEKVELITEFGYEYCPRCGAKMDWGE